MTNADLVAKRLGVAEAVKAHLSSRFPSPELTVRPDGELVIKTPAADLVAVAEALRSYEPHPLAYLSSVSGVDWPDRGKVEVVYSLHSMPDPTAKVSLRVEADRVVADGVETRGPEAGRPRKDSKLGRVPSLVSVWPTAEFQEREVFDLYGVEFEGHPDMRRILLDPSFVGHPLRKDFVDQRPAHRRVTRVDYQPDEGLAECEPEEFRPVPEEVGEHELVVNMGPSHPSTHGVLRVILRVDAETVLDAKPDLGFLHRCIEKLAEGWTWQQVVPLVDRTDYVSSMTNELAYVLAVEKLAGIEVPERAQVIRVIIAELQRIASHLVWFGSFGNDLGATSAFIYAIREREKILDLFEAVSGARLTYSYMRIGGVRNDLPPGFVEKTREFLKLMPGRLREYEDLLLKNAIFIARTKGVGKLSAAEAIALGASGPVLRASGVDFDLRRDEPYAAYGKFNVRVPVGKNGDVYDRSVCRFEEMRASLDIIAQALEALPEGEVMAKVPRVLKPPAGDVYGRIESPRGEVGVYLVSDGGPNPYRMHWRAPSFVHLMSLPVMCRGYMVADVVANIGSIDIILGEVDR